MHWPIWSFQRVLSKLFIDAWINDVKAKRRRVIVFGRGPYVHIELTVQAIVTFIVQFDVIVVCIDYYASDCVRHHQCGCRYKWWQARLGACSIAACTSLNIQLALKRTCRTGEGQIGKGYTSVLVESFLYSVGTVNTRCHVYIMHAFYPSLPLTQRKTLDGRGIHNTSVLQEGMLPTRNLKSALVSTFWVSFTLIPTMSYWGKHRLAITRNSPCNIPGVLTLKWLQ